MNVTAPMRVGASVGPFNATLITIAGNVCVPNKATPLAASNTAQLRPSSPVLSVTAPTRVGTAPGAFSATFTTIPGLAAVPNSATPLTASITAQLKTSSPAASARPVPTSVGAAVGSPSAILTTIPGDVPVPNKA